MKKIILGHCNSILSMILDCEYKININNEFDIISNLNNNDEKEYIIDAKKINEYYHDNYIYTNLQNYILGVSSPKSKYDVFTFFNKNYGIKIENYCNIFSNETIFPTKFEIGNGCFINPGVVIGPFTKIKNFVTINRNSSIGHHVILDDFVTINPGVNIGGSCKIGKYSKIGIGATILNDVIIGNNVLIGAGSVVTKNIPNDVIYYGVPAKYIRDNDIILNIIE